VLLFGPSVVVRKYTVGSFVEVSGLSVSVVGANVVEVGAVDGGGVVDVIMGVVEKTLVSIVVVVIFSL